MAQGTGGWVPDLRPVGQWATVMQRAREGLGRGSSQARVAGTSTGPVSRRTVTVGAVSGSLLLGQLQVSSAPVLENWKEGNCETLYLSTVSSHTQFCVPLVSVVLAHLPFAVASEYDEHFLHLEEPTGTTLSTLDCCVLDQRRVLDSCDV